MGLSLRDVWEVYLISAPTVFVVGAGASKPYGLPLGEELKQNILQRYHDTGCVA